MRNVLDRFVEFYSDGISLISESLAQISHVTCMISILLVLWGTVPKHDFTVWLIIFLVYFVNLSINGYMKFNSNDMVYWFKRKNIENVDKHEEAVKIEKNAMKAYIVINVCLFGVGAVLTNVKEALIIAVIAIAVTIFFIKASEVIISHIVSFKGNKTILQELRDMNPIVYEMIFLVLLIGMFVVPVAIMNISIIFKFLIVFAYFWMLPIISGLADEGIDISWLME